MVSTKEKAAEVRKIAFQLMHDVGGGHYGGNLSQLEILTSLYDGEMNIDPHNLTMPDRDRFVLSKGHGGYGYYAVLNYFGFVDYKTLSEKDKCGVMIPKHVSKDVPGVEVSTGSLGQGLSIAVGMAIAAKRDGKGVRVFTMLGDGECNEGQVWEAAMTANKYKLGNLIAIIDNNKLAFDGPTEEVMPMESFEEKFKAFGWNTLRCDGHDCDALHAAIKEAKQETDRPTVIVADTIKGKGISFMENVVTWHAGNCNDEEYAQGMKELEG